LRLTLILLFALFITACSTSPSKPGHAPVSEVEFSNLYLRGVFNWWEASASYQLKRSASGWYVDVELIADGQPYDFRLSDKHWSSGQTCGSEYQGERIITEQTTYLICGDASQNLQFTPGQTGVYRFRFAESTNNRISLSIARR
tara:strand:+ start:776 stop:1207 length:432 start_codon:yes stop_codon:yes gene_type:complete